MTDVEKLTALKTIMNIESADTGEDVRLTAYLKMAESEIIAWRWQYVPTIKKPLSIPFEFEQIQIWAVVTGYSMSGAEGEAVHNENGINRTFVCADMVQYIHKNVMPMCGVL